MRSRGNLTRSGESGPLGRRAFAFWWVLQQWRHQYFAGIALFEVFHEVRQYCSVWIYNRSRVEKDNTIGGFMRFVFRRSGSLGWALYRVGLFAHGSLGYFTSHLEVETVKRVPTGVV